MCSIRSLLVIHQKRISHINSDASKQTGLNNEDIVQHISLSQTAHKYMDQFKSNGWLVRFTESRDARLRTLAWDLLTELFDFQALKANPSIVN